MKEGKLGLGSATLAYLALVAGMAAIGTATQTANVVGGLWFTEAVAIALPAVVAMLFARVRLAPYLGFRKATFAQLGVALALAAANQPVVSFITWAEHELLPHAMVADFDAKQKMLDAIFRQNALPMVITVVIAAPLGEEIFFRGFAFPAFSRTLGVLGGLLLSGACFSFIHLDPVGFLGLMEIGILMAALRYWSGSIWPAVLGHAVNNGIAGAAFMMGYEDPDVPPEKWFLALGALLLVAGIALLVRLLRGPRPAPGEESSPGASRLPHAVVLSVLWALAMAGSVGRLTHRL